MAEFGSRHQPVLILGGFLIAPQAYGPMAESLAELSGQPVRVVPVSRLDWLATLTAWGWLRLLDRVQLLAEKLAADSPSGRITLVGHSSGGGDAAPLAGRAAAGGPGLRRSSSGGCLDHSRQSPYRQAGHGPAPVGGSAVARGFLWRSGPLPVGGGGSGSDLADRLSPLQKDGGPLLRGDWWPSSIGGRFSNGRSSMPGWRWPGAGGVCSLVWGPPAGAARSGPWRCLWQPLVRQPGGGGPVVAKCKIRLSRHPPAAIGAGGQGPGFMPPPPRAMGSTVFLPESLPLAPPPLTQLPWEPQLSKPPLQERLLLKRLLGLRRPRPPRASRLVAAGGRRADRCGAGQLDPGQLGHRGDR